MMEPLPLLQMKGISKHFPGVQALDGVDFDVFNSEVHALVGENGAGKSTLMKILAGLYRPDAGQMIFKGKNMIFASPSDAWKSGISVIYQELMLVPYLSVAENIYLGKVPTSSAGFVSKRMMKKDAAKLLARLEIDIDPDALVRDLPVAVQQMVEIVRALSYDSELIIMDEPTSSLSQHEVSVLFQTIERLRKDGRGVIFISHKLEEVFKIADRITVLRDGHNVGTSSSGEITENRLVQWMVGREVEPVNLHTDNQIGEPILEVNHITRQGQFFDVSFTLRAGEILGLGGLIGAGRTDIIRAIFGAEKIERGSICLKGKPIRINNPRAAIRQGIGFVPEDRKAQSLFLPLDIQDNLLMVMTESISRNGILDLPEEERLANNYVDQLQIRTPSLKQKIINLSGGNQQKVILARWLAMKPSLLIVDEPTRGIDVGAKAEIHSLLRQLASSGVSILLVSSEMNELLAVSDRILVIREGRVVGEIEAQKASQEKIASLAIGVNFES